MGYVWVYGWDLKWSLGLWFVVCSGLNLILGFSLELSLSLI